MSDLYFRGVPVGPDVDKLVKEFGPLSRNGRVITHDEFEKALGVKRDESRYRTVTTAYRKRVWDLYEVVISGRRAMGQGYRCLTADETVEEEQKKLRSSGKAVRNGFVHVQSMPDGELSEDHKVLKRKYLSLTEGVIKEHLAAAAVLKDTAMLPS